MLWPDGSTSMPKITSPFGYRRHPLSGEHKLHAGVDFVGFSTVRSVAAGRVVAVGTPRGWVGGGTQVWIQHDGFLSRSLHLVRGSILVQVGDWVAEGAPLALMGNTGASGGVHLHLEIVYGGRQVDPVPFIQARLTPPTPVPRPPAPIPPVIEPTLEELMSFKSVLIAHQVKAGVDSYNSTALDWEDGAKSVLSETNDSYTRAWGRILTEGGAVVITEGHYRSVLKEFDAFQARQRAHELAVAKAQGGR